MMRSLCLAGFLVAGATIAGAQQADTSGQQLLPEVTVRAFEQNRRLRDVPAAINIINRQVLDRFGPAALVSAVNSTAGVRMEERSPGSYRINIRGSALRSPFGVRNVKVYLNDIPFTQPGGTTYLNQLGFYNIQQMEIIKGPGSSLYGAGTGGVLLLESLEGEAASGVRADYTYGSFGSHNAYAAATMGREGGVSRISYQHQQSEGYREQSKLRRDVAAYTGRYQLAPGTVLKTTFLYSDLSYGTPGALTAAEFSTRPWTARPGTPSQPSAVQANAAIGQQTFVGGLSLEQKITEAISNNTVVYGASTRLRNPNIRGYDQSTEPHAGGRSTFSFRPTLAEGSLLLQAGFEGQWGSSEISNAKNSGGRPDSLRYRDDVQHRQVLGFVQGTYNTGQWQFTTGASINSYKVAFQRFAPQTSGLQTRRFTNELAARLAVLRRVGTVNIYSSVSRGFSPPTLGELLPTGGTINTGLAPEAGTNYDLGAKGNLGKLRFDLNLFYFNLNNTIVQRRDAAGGDLYLNSGETDQKGLEASLQYPLFRRGQTSALLWAAYTHHAFRYRNFKPLNNDFSGKRMPGVAPNQLAAGTDIAYGNLVVQLTYQYTDVLALNDANAAKSAVNHLVGSQVQYRLGVQKRVQWQLYAGADNLLNQRYSLGYDINAFGGRFFNTAPPRNYFLGARVELK